jgi:glucose uptake protein GlcU
LEGDCAVIREELSRLFTREERHRRLLARLLLAFGVTIVVFAAGTVLTWALESGQKGGDIHGFGDAAFFTAVQLLTVSSQIRNPLTSAGKIVDVGLELWAVFVVTVVAGSFATFFSSGDSS